MFVFKSFNIFMMLTYFPSGSRTSKSRIAKKPPLRSTRFASANTLLNRLRSTTYKQNPK